jgi:cysteine desulfurase
MARNNKSRNKIIVSAVEHKSILEPAKRLSKEGYELIVLPVDRNGVVKLDVAEKVIDQNALIVSVQGANNEIGVLQPVREIARLAHKSGAFCHCDAAQMLGKVPINLEDLGVDAASFSAHKVYGPKGVGALYLSDKLLHNAINPICYGGGQEKQLRPGTVNVPAITGFACACRLLVSVSAADHESISNLREKCEEMLLTAIEGSSINGRSVPRLPGTISLTLPNIPADMLVANLQSVCVSVGSACNSGVPEPSHVLLAMNMDKEKAESTLRISLGRYTTEDEIVIGCSEIITAARELINKLNA